MATIKLYDNAADNAAYMQGYVAGHKATGEDWVRVRLELDSEREQKEQAWVNEHRIAEAAMKRISELEYEVERLKSRLLAYQIACRSLIGDELETGRQL